MSEPTRILVAEDDESTREALVLALQQEGYEVMAVADGRSALELIYPIESNRSDHSIDLIVLDVMLPRLNGLDLCRYLRSEGDNIPILMISARGSEIDRVVGLEVGADDYLAKPFGMRELVARCRALLRRRSPLPSVGETPLSWGEIVLYPESCRVLLKGEEMPLTPKEFRLLDLFMRHPRRVWNREELIERVWGQDFMGDIKTVDVHIRWLREKLEENPSKPKYIVTIRGFGYRFG
jgi:two-component system phosphate regulon response regulator PhoB